MTEIKVHESTCEQLSSELILEAILVSQAACAELMKVADETNETNKELSSRLIAIGQFEDRLRQMLEPLAHFGQALDATGDETVIRGMLDELAAAYTMEEQRRVHDRVVGDGADSDGISSPSIELF